MDRGTYAAASAGMINLTKLEVVNNNLANLSTPGFKGQYLVTEKAEFEDTLASTMGTRDPYAKGDHDRTPAVKMVSTVTDFSLGPIEHTGQPLHAALRNPNDFFVVNSPEGPLYTRAGNFTLDETGRLITQDGFSVQSDGGEVVVAQGIPQITSGGQVQVTGLPGGVALSAGAIRVERFEDPTALERVGANKFRLRAGAPAGQPIATPAMAPGALEKANVSAVQAMVELITVSRGFELYTKSAQSIDNINSTVIQRIGSRTA